MLLSAGTRLGRYEIVALIGAGGMGEVYSARDPRLGREVALKLLPRELATDSDRLRRFEQEARAASGLDHPGIVTVHEIAEENGQPFIVMQLVRGRTLRQRMRDGRIPLAEAIDYAVQIADALASAHARDIVHRDLKPENVMLGEDGHVRILDFGLAKLVEPPEGSSIETLSMESPRTREGQVVGTAPYMSPEQARGHKVDARSDIFSLGSVLYEMVAGRRPFSGENLGGVLASILRDDPKKLSESVPAVPLALEVLVARALRKDPARRFQSAADLKVALLEVSEELASGEVVSAADVAAVRRGKRRVPWARAAVPAVIAATLVAVGWHFLARAPKVIPPLRVVPVTSFPRNERDPALSPDGRQVAFVWNGGEGGLVQLHVKLVGAGEPLRLTRGPSDAACPAWSPDGRQIAFLRHRDEPPRHEIWAVPAQGGRELKLGTTDVEAHGLSWSPDGKLLAVVDKASEAGGRGIFLISTATGERQKIEGAAGLEDLKAVFSPDGKTLALQRRRTETGTRELALQPLDGRKPSTLVLSAGEPWDLDWTSDGSALVVVVASPETRATSLWRVPTSGAAPEPLPVGESATQVSIARSGSGLVYTKRFADCNVWRAPGPAARTGSPAARLLASTRVDWFPRFSPDGGRITLASDRSGSMRIWVCDAQGAGCTELPSKGSAFDPSFSPDGRSVVFSDDGTGKGDIYTVGLSEAFPRRLTHEESRDDGPSWSHDGRYVYFTSNRDGTNQVWKAPAAGGGAVQVTKRGGDEPWESEDGRLVYYSREAGIFRVPVAGGDEAFVLGGVERTQRAWLLWRDSILYLPAEGGSLLNRFDIVSGKTSRFAELGAASCNGLSVSQDGQALLYVKDEGTGYDILLVENFR